jgi:Ca2+ transporting ATPase
VNIVAVSSTLIDAVLIRQETFTSVQMLWVKYILYKNNVKKINLIMDSLASLALATEPPSPDLIDKKPHNRNDKILTKVI